MRKRLALLVALLLQLAIVGCSIGVSSTHSTPSSSLSLLYVLSSNSGTLTPAEDGSFELVLSGVDPDVIMFSDRPQRAAGSLGLTEWVSSWSANGFESSPPNIALMLRVTDGRDTVVGTLETPTLNGEANELRATFRLLETVTGQATPGPDLLSRDEVPPTFTDVSVFVDDATAEGCPDTTTWVPNAGPNCVFIFETWIPFLSSESM